MGATRKLGADVGKKCADKAGGVREAVVRLILAEAGPPKEVVILEPGLSAGLKDCLTRELRAGSLPATPAALAAVGRQLVTVPLAGAAVAKH
jgi:hypothetical protein